MSSFRRKPVNVVCVTKFGVVKTMGKQGAPFCVTEYVIGKTDTCKVHDATRAAEPAHSMERLWSALPPDIRIAILMHVSLSVLRLLKSVNNETANHCRRVIRSRAWQAEDRNEYDLFTALSGSTSHIKFPFAVTISDSLVGNQAGIGLEIYRKSTYITATIHNLSWVCYRDDFSKCSILEACNAKWIGTIKLLDLCIEVDGHGIVSSEPQLRVLIQDIVDERGWMNDDEWPVSIFKQDDSGWGFSLRPDMSWNNRQIDAKELLQQMFVITEVASGKWMHQETECGTDDRLSVFGLMAFGLGPFGAK